MNAPFQIQNQNAASSFVQRHIGPRDRDVDEMLKVAGVASLNDLMDQTVPSSIRQGGALATGEALSEIEALERMRSLASENQVFISLLGQGYHGSILPSVILRNVLENPAWYTAYTPYQPEISQGRLEALLNFQTMIADLTGLDIANASMLDEATAAAEAMGMAYRLRKTERYSFFVDHEVHPQTLAVLKTRAEPLGWKLVVGDPEHDLKPDEVFGALFQYPGTHGSIRDFRIAIAALREAGAYSIVCADLLALTLIAPPGELGADIAVGSAQRFGLPMGFGGPHAGYLACIDSIKRAIPGRLVGVSIDARGESAYRLALQTREQHIRRDKATSNICTAQALLAIIASMYAVYHGPEGLRHIAESILRRSSVLKKGLANLGFATLNETHFDTLTIHVGQQQSQIIERARADNMNFRVVGKDRIGITLDESSSSGIVERIWSAFGGAFSYSEVEADVTPVQSLALRRASTFLSHSVFNRYRSETDMLRYIRKLSDRDLALDRAMIPLGSCTMKLNATTEMMPIGFSGFSDIHPFAPAEQWKGYARMFRDIERMLCEITGYDAFSLQPNSGAQGEYAGLLAIRSYHRSRSEGHRSICLIPSSAHGTNPASAQMAGFEIVVVNCDAEGNVDLSDLRIKAQKNADALAAIMITYPSTHGVFEEHIREICQIVHDNGGQVYLDGANMNAQVGLARPGHYGADVSHLNLHKTFCIPHGGGGPGMGPIGVKAHLTPFLPGHFTMEESRMVGAVSAAPYGSALILPISYCYMLMMGGDGLRRATEMAILNANYIAVSLDPYFPVLYKNKNGRVAHECIVDPRPLKEKCGVTVDDIAKRLIDFGFHAPTMSFPVAGTLMIEPTESESKMEIDRFINAMIAIRREISVVESGRLSIGDSPLRYAPHTTADVASDNWARKYTRSEGCFPVGSPIRDKYWSPVNRIDNVWGDRNLMCSCPPVSEFQNSI